MFQEISELLRREANEDAKSAKSVARRPTIVVAVGVFGGLAVVGFHHPVASGADGFVQSGAGPGHQRDLAMAVTWK